MGDVLIVTIWTADEYVDEGQGRIFIIKVNELK